jgi:hypothetical protein
MNQKALINTINEAIPEAEATSTADFYGKNSEKNGTGIWIKGSEEYAADGKRIFKYQAAEGKSLHPKINKLVNGADWYEEPYDAGTCMLYKS